ncbi:MAG: GNAT family N-acetyltransferase [Candidatus Eisenbacteria bacterium]
MATRPTLETKRLVLRPFELKDAADIQRLAGDRAVADTVLNIPHPYEDGMAEEWISSHQENFNEDKGVTFAVISKEGGHLMGAISLMGISRRFSRAELGYWIGKPYWNQGFCTEAGETVLKYGFEEMGLNRIFASHFSRNPASGRVMAKLGMQHEGCLKQHIRRWDRYEDMVYCGILADEWKGRA